MKQSLMSAQQLAERVQGQANAAKDFVAPANRMRFFFDTDATPNQTKVGMTFERTNSNIPALRASVNGTAHQQLATYADVPLEYSRRIEAAHPRLWASTYNNLIAAKPADEKRLVRTFEAKQVRAVLSDRYRPLDNIGLIEHLLPFLFERKDLRFASADVTESRLYLKVVSDALEGEVKRGDVVRMGLLISNSEVGTGALTVAPFSERLICLNGATHTELGKRRNHVGKALGGDDAETFELYSDETRRADDKAFFLKVRDVITNTLTGKTLDHLLQKMRDASQDRLEGNPADVVEVVGRRIGLNESERGDALRHLIEGADLSRWGLANAITRIAQDTDDYDRATQIETLGGNMMLAPVVTKGDLNVERRRRAVAATAN